MFLVTTEPITSHISYKLPHVCVCLLPQNNWWLLQVRSCQLFRLIRTTLYRVNGLVSANIEWLSQTADFLVRLLAHWLLWPVALVRSLCYRPCGTFCFKFAEPFIKSAKKSRLADVEFLRSFDGRATNDHPVVFRLYYTLFSLVWDHQKPCHVRSKIGFSPHNKRN